MKHIPWDEKMEVDKEALAWEFARMMDWVMLSDAPMYALTDLQREHHLRWGVPEHRAILVRREHIDLWIELNSNGTTPERIAEIERILDPRPQYGPPKP